MHYHRRLSKKKLVAAGFTISIRGMISPAHITTAVCFKDEEEKMVSAGVYVRRRRVGFLLVHTDPTRRWFGFDESERKRPARTSARDEGHLDV